MADVAQTVTLCRIITGSVVSEPPSSGFSSLTENCSWTGRPYNERHSVRNKRTQTQIDVLKYPRTLDTSVQTKFIIIIFLHGLGHLTCSGIDALPSFPGASTISSSSRFVYCVRNVVAQGDAREGKWRGNWRMAWVASTITRPRNVVYQALLPLKRTPPLPAVDWTDSPHRFKWTRPFRRKTKCGFCACAIRFRTSSPDSPVPTVVTTPTTPSRLQLTSYQFQMPILDLYDSNKQALVATMIMTSCRLKRARYFCLITGFEMCVSFSSVTSEIFPSDIFSVTREHYRQAC